MAFDSVGLLGCFLALFSFLENLFCGNVSATACMWELEDSHVELVSPPTFMWVSGIKLILLWGKYFYLVSRLTGLFSCF